MSKEKPTRFVRGDDVTKANFLHGGCGFCVSRSLATQMRESVGNGNLVKLSAEMGWRYNDDVMMGYVTNKLGVSPTTTRLMHSHHRLHAPVMTSLSPEELAKQVSVSYADDVTLNIPVMTSSEAEDPSRFFSLHCLLNPGLENC